MRVYLVSEKKNHHTVSFIADQLHHMGHNLSMFYTNENHEIQKEYKWIRGCDVFVLVSPTIELGTWALVGCSHVLKVPVLGLLTRDEPTGNPWITKEYRHHNDLLSDLDNNKLKDILEK